MVTTRFAPSPTGYLHLGHAYAALVAHDLARAGGGRFGGRFLLRIEDIDRARCREAYTDAIYEDLAWLGLVWDAPPLVQSKRRRRYHAALEQLRTRGLIYPCSCTRGEIEAARAALGPRQESALLPPIYPGLCRGRPASSFQEGDAWRLDMGRALEALAREGVTQFSYEEEGVAPGRVTHHADEMASLYGDIVLARKDIGLSYHLCVVIDDAASGVTLVSRGMDMAQDTPLHLLLQALMGLPQPRYHHHALIRDSAGKRLAKRDKSREIRRARAEGQGAAELCATLMAQADAQIQG